MNDDTQFYARVSFNLWIAHAFLISNNEAVLVYLARSLRIGGVA